MKSIKELEQLNSFERLEEINSQIERLKQLKEKTMDEEYKNIIEIYIKDYTEKYNTGQNSPEEMREFFLSLMRDVAQLFL